MWVPAALRRRGITVREVKGWRARGRPFNFRPVGVMRHHTAAAKGSGDAPSLRVCVEGRAGIPGPLCQLLVARSLVAYMIAAGRANHAGAGGPFRNVPPDSGNTYFVGVEYEEDGRDEVWPRDMLLIADEIDAVLLAGLKRTASWMLGHKQWAPKRKIDPRPMDMAAARTRVAHRIEIIRRPRPRPGPPRFPGRLLAYRRGPLMRGADVRRWQEQMLRRGWGHVLGKADGFYGPRSERTCVLFQRRKGLAPDGIVGPRTWAATFS